MPFEAPEEGSIFPPEITAPMFLWRDGSEGVQVWLIEVDLADGTPAIRARSTGLRMRIDGTEAVKLAERAVKATGAGEPAALDTLAAAYAETGQFAKAIETGRRAVALAIGANQQHLAEAVKARIALYERQTPFRSR
jgi:hypothetical protein